ncbi:DMT family transporter [Chitinimonas sp.]|uniref:DMT family transporter n=1 Tax=Chitinimonas sp. TaxID=1934313 RepID=UPI002F953D46
MAEILLLLVAVVWGTSYGLAKEAVLLYPVLGFLAARFCLTFLILSPAAWRELRRHPRLALSTALPLGGLLLAIFLCETWGVAHTSAANAAFLISLCVVLTPFAEWLLLKQAPSRTAFVAAGISLCGTALLTGSIHLQLNLGDGLMLAAAALRALFVCMTRRLTADQPISTLGLTGLQTGVVGLGCLILAGLQPTPLPALPASSVFWGIVAYMVLFCTLFAFFAQNWAIRRSGPSRAALLTGSEPLWGALFAMAWLGEAMTPQAVLGGLLILGASLWAALPERRPLAASPAAG